MSIIEKIGLVILIMFYAKNFPESWRGAEIVIGMVGLYIFIFGSYIQSWIDAFRNV